MAARDPEECDTLFGKFVNAADLEGVLSLYEDDATLVRPDGSSATGKAEIRAFLESTQLENATITTHVVNQVSGGTDIAVLFNDWSMTADTADGQQARFAFGAIEVVRRQPDGSWKFVIDHPYAIPK